MAFHWEFQAVRQNLASAKNITFFSFREVGLSHQNILTKKLLNKIFLRKYSFKNIRESFLSFLTIKLASASLNASLSFESNPGSSRTFPTP